jgi:predicted nucleic acid-binding protein
VVELAVTDASPLILLARGGYIDLLKLAANRVAVPEPVAFEIQRRGPLDVTARALREHDWLEIIDAPPTPSTITEWGLGAGESAVLALALSQPGCEALVDDKAARMCAATLGIRIRGTLGLVLLAKRRGVIPQARAVVTSLRQSGMYLSDSVVRYALALVGE